MTELTSVPSICFGLEVFGAAVKLQSFALEPLAIEAQICTSLFLL
jgi:hypothetical protein